MGVHSLSQKENETNKKKQIQENRKSRGHWGNYTEFILSCIGFSVGIGNVWRFPYICYENGGGAFLIPFMIILILIGIPLYFLELGLGQFTRLGPPGAFNLVPMCMGIGVAMLIVSAITGIYYNVVMAYTLFYTFASFQKVLPWTHCNGLYNTPNCFLRTNQSFLFSANSTNSSLLNSLQYNTSHMISSSEEYWLNRVLDINSSSGMHDLGSIKWELALCLLLSWAIVFLTLSKGISSAGKAIYFTATFPYVILMILLVRGVTLDGAKEGIMYFIKPQWGKLTEIKVWREAAGQVFFSLSVGFGGIIAFSSFNAFDNDCHRDAWIVSVADTVTSLLSGLVIFSVMGFMSKYMGGTDEFGNFTPLPITEVVKSGGPGLAFIAYPEALARLYKPQLWTVMFFSMLYMLGLNSEVAYIETILSALHDNFPNVFPWKYKTWTCLGACIIGFLFGLPCVTQGGQFVVKFLDHFGSTFMVVMIGAFEVIGIMWIYGYNRFLDDMQTMMGKRIPLLYYWLFTWVFAAPIMLMVIFIVSIADSHHLEYQNYIYDLKFHIIGWIIVIVGLGQIPLWAVINITKQPGPWRKKFRRARHPGPDMSHVHTVTRDLFAVQSQGSMNNSNILLQNLSN
ncbi:unnamed protein product [Gordionus sp. m RMFG-2023]|uniref:sodium- and chloride-dependent glycine transporter 2-like n=1 Tax=Gordionus sp. m RMFG-2023 TaxID=3053472 RepID=UPI0030E0DF4F